MKRVLRNMLAASAMVSIGVGLIAACAPTVPTANGPQPIPTAKPAQETGKPEYWIVQQHTMKNGWECFTFRDALWCGK